MATRTVRAKKPAKKTIKRARKKATVGRGVTPPQAITHIFRHKKLGQQYKDRVDSIIAHFPKAKVIDIEKDSDETVLEKIQEIFPKIVGSSAKAVNVSKRILVIGKASNKTLVAPFEQEKDLVCPRFHKIVPMSNGCIYNCEYCYLQATYRGKLPYMKMNVNWETLVAQMKRVIAEEKKKGRVAYFNMGELMDSLSFDAVTGFLPFLMEQMESSEFDGSELLLLSKSAEVANLVKFAPKFPKAVKRMVVSWSVNSPTATKLYEHGSANAVERLKAARAAQQAGYRIRLRIDPMIPFDGWEDEYPFLVDLIYGRHKLKPEVITIGSLRHENSLIPIARKRFPKTDLFDLRMVKAEGDKKRLPFEQRFDMYKTIIDAVRAYRKDQVVTPCKERDMMWVKLGFDLSDKASQACNCVAKWSFADIRTGLPKQAIELPKHTVKIIPLNQLLNDDTHRYRSPESVEGMKESIADSGVLFPIDVIEVKKNTFQIVNGFRRVLGCKALGKTSIPARVFKKLSVKEIRRLKGAENHARKTMDPVETYRFVADCKRDGMSVPKIVKVFSLQERQVRKYSVIHDGADQTTKDRFLHGDLSVTEAYQIAQGNRGVLYLPRNPAEAVEMKVQDQVITELGGGHHFTVSVKPSKTGKGFSIGIGDISTTEPISPTLNKLAKVFRSEEVQTTILEMAQILGEDPIIEWSGDSWNPITGCTKISPGCKYCYAERLATDKQDSYPDGRYKKGFTPTFHKDLLTKCPGKKKPVDKPIFICSMSDLFHTVATDQNIIDIFKVMNELSHNKFVVLTKRSDRMLALDKKVTWSDNIIAGVSVEDSDPDRIARIDHLLQIGAKTKMIHIEPILSSIPKLKLKGIDWVVVGGESGTDDRLPKVEWVTDIRDQCEKASVPFTFKQWGGISRRKRGCLLEGRRHGLPDFDEIMSGM